MKVYTAYYLEEEKDLRQIKKHPKDVQKIYHILKFFEKKNKTYKDARLTKNSRYKLFAHLQTQNIYTKQTEFTDEIDDKLFEFIKQLFNITEIKSENKAKKDKLEKNYKINSLKYKNKR